MRKFKAIVAKDKPNTLQIVDTTQIHGINTKIIGKMTIIDLIRIGIGLKGALSADARTVGQLGTHRRNMIRLRRDTGRNSTGN
jgi:hypothetical protein